ncbi:MAG: hypothetical protein LLG04_10950 [Parachlamydia sp.]|nr:hypothetical protein [Parachlamydia sp.]
MKPDWKDAPSWANYLAQDEVGLWFWYEEEPNLGRISWSISGGRHCVVRYGDWRDSLEERPSND